MIDKILGGVDAGTNLLSTAGNLWAFQKNLKFQKEAAQSKYQWAVEDMKKAGLNPVLAATGGFGGGGTPSGGAAAPHLQGTDLLAKRLAIAQAKQIEQETKNKQKTGQLIDKQNKAQDLANTAAAFNLNRTKVHGDWWADVDATKERFQNWSAKSWRDFKNRLGYWIQEMQEKGDESTNRQKQYIDIHPRKR